MPTNHAYAACIHRMHTLGGLSLQGERRPQTRSLTLLCSELLYLVVVRGRPHRVVGRTESAVRRNSHACGAMQVEASVNRPEQGTSATTNTFSFTCAPQLPRHVKLSKLPPRHSHTCMTWCCGRRKRPLPSPCTLPTLTRAPLHSRPLIPALPPPPGCSRLSAYSAVEGAGVAAIAAKQGEAQLGVCVCTLANADSSLSLSSACLF